jgi:O-antigen/teichoic acid export membrane protein
VFRGFELFKFENITRLWQGASLAISVITLIELGASDLNLMVALLAASNVVSALYMVFSLIRRYPVLAWHWDLARMKDWLTEAIPLGICESIRGQAWQMDTVILGLLQPAAVVGLYSVAYRPLTILNWLPLAAAAATFPMLVRLAGSPAQFNRAVANSTRMLLINALPLAVVISVGAEYLVTTLAGKEYVDAAMPMRILVWKILLSSLAILYRLVFAAVGKLPALARLILLGAALDAASELVLIPLWGYLGACCGSLIGEVAFDLMALQACRALGIQCINWRSLAGAVVAAGTMAAALSLARGTALPVFILAAGGATLLYFAVCLLTGALNWNELRHLSDSIRGVKATRDRESKESETDETGAMTATRS